MRRARPARSRARDRYSGIAYPGCDRHRDITQPAGHAGHRDLSQRRLHPVAAAVRRYTVVFELPGFAPQTRTSRRADAGRAARSRDGARGAYRDGAGRRPRGRRADGHRAGGDQLQPGTHREPADRARHQRHADAGAVGAPDRSRRAHIRLPARSRSRTSSSSTA